MHAFGLVKRSLPAYPLSALFIPLSDFLVKIVHMYINIYGFHFLILDVMALRLEVCVPFGSLYGLPCTQEPASAH